MPPILGSVCSFLGVFQHYCGVLGGEKHTVSAFLMLSSQVSMLEGIGVEAKVSPRPPEAVLSLQEHDESLKQL